MGRKVVKCMDRIFEILEEVISSDDAYRKVDVKRHIQALGNELIVIDFVKTATVEKEYFGEFPASVFYYKGKKYILVIEKFADAIREIGFNEIFGENESEDDKQKEDGNADNALEIIQGCEMLAIIEGVINVSPAFDSMDIIDACFGLGEDEDDIVFTFDNIRKFFDKSVVFEIDDNRFPLLYAEDYYRLSCYCMCEKSTLLAKQTVESIKQILLLDSSRSVSASITNALKSSIEEYAFLQFYQCLEYLFRLNNSFKIKSLYHMGVSESIDLVTEYEFKLTEGENLRRVLVENTTEADIDRFIVSMGESICADDTREKKTEYVSQCIYKVRCKVAHLRYEPKNLSETIDWKKLLTAIVDLVLATYQHCDKEIIVTCCAKKVWDEIIF